MPDPLVILRLLPLLLAGGLAAWPRKLDSRDISGGLARMGYGGVKLLVLSVFLEEVFHLCQGAEPLVKTGWASFISMVSFTGMIYLFLSGAADVYAGFLRLWKRAAPELTRDPFWADGFTDFWCRWGCAAAFQTPTFRSALIRCGLLLLTVILWMGWQPGMGIWLIFQAGLLGAEAGIVKQTSGRVRVPRILRSVLPVVVFTLSSPLLYAGSVDAALQEWTSIFQPPTESLYTLFLDQRLTTSRSCWLLWASVLVTLALPSYSWWIGQGQRLRVLAKGLGLVFLAVLVGVGLGSVIPGKAQVASQSVILWLNADGNAQVHIGADGWLYSRHELDGLTQRPEWPELSLKVQQLKKTLQTQGTELLLLPIPDKVSLYPEAILPGKYWAPVLPPGYAEKLKSLRDAGVDVLDFTTKLWDQRNTRPLYGRQDSLWTADAMKELAVQASRHIRKTYPQVVLDETPLVDAVFMERQDVGDLARALAGETAQHLWDPESIQMVGLRGLHGAAESPVLVVGGALVRVFDDPDFSFGPTSADEAPAGWPTQLGALIGRALDVTDEAPAEDLAQRAQGKKLVVWVVRAGDL